MKILYVSTFNKKIFDLSAKNMIESFMKKRIEGELFLCSEEMTYDPQNPAHLFSRKSREIANKKKNKIRSYRFEEYEYIKNWIDKYKHYIPKHMGGIATEASMPKAFTKGNLRTAGWFRKIATMRKALEIFGDSYDIIIFVDADCVFNKKITTDLVLKAFGKDSVFYHLGKHRIRKGMGVETGFTGFKMDKVGKEIIREWIRRYDDGECFNYRLWHDSYVLYEVLKDREYKGARDLVKNYSEIGKAQSHVVDRGIFAGYVEHKKGLHKRAGVGEKGGIVK